MQKQGAWEEKQRRERLARAERTKPKANYADKFNTNKKNTSRLSSLGLLTKTTWGFGNDLGSESSSDPAPVPAWGKTVQKTLHKPVLINIPMPLGLDFEASVHAYGRRVHRDLVPTTCF